MSESLIFGTVSGTRLTALSPVGVVNDRVIYPLVGAEEDNNDDANHEGEENDDEGDDEEDESGEESEKDKKPNRRKQAARNSSHAAMRRELNALKREKEAREKADREKELAAKGEAERAAGERDDAVKERDTYKSRWEAAQIELDIVKASNRAKYAWNDIEDVLNDRKVREAIEIGEDGEISGVEDALKDLAKRKPHFLAKSEEDNSGKGTGTRNSNGNGRSSGGTGKTGSQPTGGGSDNRATDRQRLAAAYPALGQHIAN